MEEQLTRYFNSLRQFSHILVNKVMTNGGMQYDMKLSQMKALAAFREDRAFTMKELAANGMVKLPNMTNMVDNLIQEKLAERQRDAQDRRKVLVRLTAQGRELRNRFMASRRDLAMSIFANLSEEKKTELLNSLEKVCTILGETIEGEDHPNLKTTAGESHLDAAP